MDGIRFDGLARQLGSLADRRTTVRAFAGSALAVIGVSAGWEAEAKKKKKKCKSPKVKCGKKCCAAGSVCDELRTMLLLLGWVCPLQSRRRGGWMPRRRMLSLRVRLLWQHVLPTTSGLRRPCRRPILLRVPRPDMRKRLLSTRASV